ncbi:hypothetical protein WG902_06380 [Ramlibacter sp. PS3R-8]|uniref:hypothetical protein n=1 Tax=Ramlibacter sp. PS3R-8 TaxID=3133437 RepID=UPI00309F4867
MNPFFLAVGMEGGPARQALAHNGLASHAQEWNREWRRAQACAWLHATPWPGLSQEHAGGWPGGTVDARGMDVVPAASFAVMHPCVALVARQSSAVERTGVIPVASLTPAAQSFSITPNEPSGIHSPQPAVASGCRLAASLAPTEQETPHRTPAVPRESPLESDTLRLHVECADDGLHVWIGADGDAAAVSARAAAILAELRRSEHANLAPLAVVVCNGRTLYATGSRASSPLETSR